MVAVAIYYSNGDVQHSGFVNKLVIIFSFTLLTDAEYSGVSFKE